MAMKAQKLAEKLTSKYEWERFTFGMDEDKVGTETWKWRHLISCILVAGSSEKKTLACDEELFAKYPETYDLANAKYEDVLYIIDRYIRFGDKKAFHLIKTSQIVNKRYNGRVPDEREQLEKLPGVGRHIASVILATVYGQNEFAVDVHVDRITKRWNLVSEDANELEIENAIRESVKPELLGHFSRSFVDFGQNICSHTPKCADCNLSKQCPTFKGQIKVAKNPVKKLTVVEEGVWIVPGSGDNQYTVKSKNGGLSCTCKGYRFKRTCKHIAQVAAS